MAIFRTMNTILDAVSTRGLLGVADSISYLIAEIERHFHHWERWFGLAVTPVAESHRADRLGVGVAAFQIDAGNNTWGSWVQVLGSSDTPATATRVKYDFHRLEITGAEHNAPYFVQIAFGATAADALTAGTYSEVVYVPLSGVQDTGPLNIGTRRQAVTTKAWARCLCPGQNTGTLDFYIGLHEYEG